MTNDAGATIGVAVAGFGWMDLANTQASTRLLHHYPDLPLAPRLAVVADEVPGRASAAAAQFGFADAVHSARALDAMLESASSRGWVAP